MQFPGQDQDDQVTCSIPQAICSIHDGEKSEERLPPQPEKAFGDGLLQRKARYLLPALEILTNEAQRK